MPEPREPVTIHSGAIKICGIREPDHAVAATLAGADLLGFVFAPSRRQVTAEIARRCIEAARSVSSTPPLAVGVFVNASVEELNETAEAAGLDVVQLHGEINAVDRSRLNRPAVPAFHPAPAMTTAAVDAVISESMRSPSPLAVMIDAFQPGQYGGLGIRADWELAGDLARRWPIVLAGGLTADNVAEAIASVKPLGVDVSSGVERDGVKDPERIVAFIQAARAAFDRNTGLRVSESGSGAG